MDNVENENQIQNQSDQIENDAEQPEVKEESTVTKQIEKMRKRIDKEVGHRKESEDRAKKLEEQVKTLTEKLNSQSQDPTEEKSNNPDLDKAISENEKLKAQLVRRDQMDTVAQQFSEAGVNVPKDVLNLVVPVGIDEKQVSKNMRALSSFYDSIVTSVKKEFMSGPTPRTTGMDQKPFSMAEIRKIKDPVERLKRIKEHLENS